MRINPIMVITEVMRMPRKVKLVDVETDPEICKKFQEEG